jgi:hypothetical protein
LFALKVLAQELDENDKLIKAAEMGNLSIVQSALDNGAKKVKKML